jgi:hypothetical protein
MNFKPIEPMLHMAMGFAASLVNARLLLARREFRQLPPENDEFPVVYIDPAHLHHDGGYTEAYWPRQATTDNEYWSRARVLDTLNDLKQYDIGGTVGWFFLVAAAFAAGMRLG